MGQRSLETHLTDTFVGREAELAALLAVTEPSGPRVIFVHGLSGIGTSALLDRAVIDLRRVGATVHALDCREIEPTPSSVLRALAPGPHVPPEIGPVASALATDGPVVLVFDHWHHFRLLEGWFRQAFLPQLPTTVCVITGGHHPPSTAWRASPRSDAVVRQLHLDVLSREESLALLAGEGISGPAAGELYDLTRGFPLALRVAAASTERAHGGGLADLALPKIVGAITDQHLSDVAPDLRAGVDALAVVRRGTATMMAGLLPDAPSTLVGELAGLPFVRTAVDGLALHDAVRVPLRRALRSVDPQRHDAYRRAAWRIAVAELRAARPDQTWRFTADLLHLIDHPLVHDAFFPPTAPRMDVSEATSVDLDRLERTAAAHLAPSYAATVTAAARAAAQVRVARDAPEPGAGYLVMLERTSLASQPLRDDPIVAAVREHLRRHPIPAQHELLVLLVTLPDTADPGRDAAAEAALWLDIKRTYLDRREQLRRVYAVVARNTGQRFLAAAAPLGFTAVDPTVSVDGVPHVLAVLDFGPALVDGWLTWLARQQVGAEPDDLDLDPSTRTVRIGSERFVLSRLEFGVLEHLRDAGGRPVSRIELLRSTWGHAYEGGSNVVDAVVRTLRRKLGTEAAAIGTVRGIGYRYDADAVTGMANPGPRIS